MPNPAKPTTTTNDGNVTAINKDEIKRMAKDTGENVRQFISEKSEQADELRHKGEEAVKLHPYKAVGIAALGGLLLGAILRRK